MKQFDIFGGTIDFTFQGNTRQRTYPGACCSIICLTILILCFAIRSIDFIARLEMETSMTENV